MMAIAHAAFGRKPPEQRRGGAPIQSPGGNPPDLTQFAADFDGAVDLHEFTETIAPSARFFKIVI